MPQARIKSTGFYAVVDFRFAIKPIRKIGYKPGILLQTPPGRVVIQPANRALYGVDNPALDQEMIRTPLEAFLQTLYFVGASLSSLSGNFDLDEEMIEGGVDDQYGRVQITDFMAFTGALKRFQTLRNGNQVDLLGLIAGDKRPNLNDLNRSDDFKLMFGVIRHLGIQGILPYLYLREGINFKEFCDEFRLWKETAEEREEFVYGRLQPILRMNNAPVLSEENINNLIKA